MAAVSSGVALNSTPIPFLDSFVPPACGAAGNENPMKQGEVEIRIQGFPPSALTDRKLHMEKLFRDVYNEITGTEKRRVLYAWVFWK